MRLLAQQPRLSRSPFRSICTSGAEDDGVQFIADTLRAEQARAEDEYQGVRLTVVAGARLPVQVDIGFGDVVTPAAREIDFPTLLEFPAPRLRAYCSRPSSLFFLQGILDKNNNTDGATNV
jgi:hypothetical protein